MPNTAKPPPQSPAAGSSLAKWNWLLILLAWLVIAKLVFFLLTINTFATVTLQAIHSGSLLDAWIIAAAGWGALFAARSTKSAAPLLRLVTHIAVGLGAISLALLLLGLAGLLSHWLAIAIIAPGILLALFFLRRAYTPGTFLRISSSIRLRYLWPIFLIAPLAGMSLATAFVPAGFLWPTEPNGYDVAEYHLQVPREWFELGHIAPLSDNVFSYLPMNVELHYLLAMYLRGDPWSAMYVAQLMHWMLIALSVVAVYAIVSDLRRSSPDVSPFAPSTAALLAAGAPMLALLAGIAYDEGGLLLFGTLAFGWLLKSRVTDDRRIGQSAAILAGVMAGLACGSKLTAVPEVLLAMPLAIAITVLPGLGPRLLPETRRRVIAHLTAFLIVGLLVFSPWLIRNAIWTANPVFPEATAVFGHGPFTTDQAQRWDLAHQPRPDQQTIPARLHALLDQSAIFNVPSEAVFGYAAPILLLMLLLAWLQFGPSPSAPHDPVAPIAFMTILAILVFWLSLTHLQARFLIITIPILAIGVSLCARPRIFAPTALLLAIASICIGTLGFYQRWQSVLNRDRGPSGDLSSLIGLDGRLVFSELTHDELASVPPNRVLHLVGEARAYWYTRPMSLLSYRTVFNVDANGRSNAITAWLDGLPAEYVLVSPAEVDRLHRSYFDIPPLSPAMQLSAQAKGNQPFVLHSGRKQLTGAR